MARQVLLTKAELMSWRTFKDPAWGPFKQAWWDRGFRRPPSVKQRAHLWIIADSRPNDLARWTREAPGPTANDVITYIFDQWRRVTSVVFDSSPREYDPHERDPKAPKRLGDILRAAIERER